MARVFEKEHKDVLKAIENLECSSEFRLLNFGASSYLSAQNRTMPMFEVTETGFTIPSAFEMSREVIHLRECSHDLDGSLGGHL
jgi:Rha family phage regulatory protein